MDFIDGDRLLERGLSGAVLHPGFVLPDIFFQIYNPGCGRGTDFRGIGKGIGFEKNFTVLTFDLEFIKHPFVDSGKEDFPDAAAADGLHRVLQPVPVIEFTNHTEASRIRSPDREPYPRIPSISFRWG